MDDQLEWRGDAFWWPKSDQGCWDWVNREADLPARILKWVPEDRRRLVVHAGANCGFYARQYAKEFEHVMAIEPDPLNFLALARNCPEGNVHKINAALGHAFGYASFKTDHDFNRGGFYQYEGGDVPVLVGDYLVAGQVDLIHLDVEGKELSVLEGLSATLACNAPVVVIETIEGGQRYGVKDEDVVAYLRELRYRVAERLSHDTILVAE